MIKEIPIEVHAKNYQKVILRRFITQYFFFSKGNLGMQKTKFNDISYQRK